MEECSEPSLSGQHSYILAGDVDAPEFLKRLPIARSHAPRRSCGTAHRIGHTSSDTDAQPIYRLKIKEKTARWQSITLPGFFVLKNNRFVRWEPEQAEISPAKSASFQQI